MRGGYPPLKLSPSQGASPPHPLTSTSMTPQDQQHAGTTMTKPPHAVPPASFRVTPAGASTARSSHAPAPPYHLAVQTRRRVTNRTHGRPAAGTPRHRTSRCRRLCLFLCPPFTTPAPERSSSQSRPCLFMFKDDAGAGHANLSSPDRGRRRRIAPSPRRRRAQIRTQSRSGITTPRRRSTAPAAASGRRRGPECRQVFKNDHDVALGPRRLGTSPADILRLQLRLFL